MIDILMATYNGEEYIHEQIQSILNQTYKEWILYIRDDKSTDKTVSIIREFVTTYPNKIIFIEDELGSLGAKNNFSQLMNYSTNEYCMFCDQDDVWLENKIEISLEAMTKSESKYGKNMPILIHTDLTVVDEGLVKINQSYWDLQNLDSKYRGLSRLIVENNITGCTMMINKKLKLKISQIPNQAIMHDWWIGIVAGVFGKIIPINTPTILYRQHNNNVVGASNVNNISYIISKINKSEINRSIERSIVQAREFYDMYKNELSSLNKDIILTFMDLRKNNFITRKKLAITYKFYKNNKIKRLAYILFL